MFQNYFWKLFKLFNTSLILASWNDKIEIVKILIAQEGIDINVKDILLFLSIFISII